MATRKITVTVPEDLLDEIRAEVPDRSLSAYIADALRAQRERDRLVELAQWLQDEHGPLTEAERAAAMTEVAEVDAEHTRRRASQRRSA
ncbi:CopG family transcriptional regulator [Nocardia sp. GTS18]|uniref:CopG family transcriptional regulator n=1 Tax=Nocardia sp. GTS18 TaxID=1778064 RepID=UPI0015EF80C9|nr:CopG family transcriptional regulator [Nocardia sp. GTS18]